MDFPPVPLPIKRQNEPFVSRAHGNRKGLTPGEVTTLQHELGDDTVERASFVSKPVLPSSEFTEVPGSLGDNIVVQFEGDAASGLATDADIELVFVRYEIRVARSEYDGSSLAHSKGC